MEFSALNVGGRGCGRSCAWLLLTGSRRKLRRRRTSDSTFEVDETHVGYKRLYCEGRERIKPVQS